MKQILVCMKAVPVASSVEVDGQFRLKREGAKLQWNMADTAALEAALKLRGQEGMVAVLTMGPEKLSEPLRELLARGADRAVLLTDRLLAGEDTQATSRALFKAVERIGNVDAVFCGAKALDGETGQVPGKLAAALGWPCVTNAQSVRQEGAALVIGRRLEDCLQLVAAESPVVLSFCPYCYSLRLASIASMRRARGKQIEVLNAASLGLRPEECGLAGSATRVLSAQSRFPGLRNGPKEEDPEAGISYLRTMIKEARP